MKNHFANLTTILSSQFANLTDRRIGKNSFIPMQDVAMSAFSVFLTQPRSFLEHQRFMEASDEQNNARAVFDIAHIPSDNHIRSLLDEVPPCEIFPCFDWLLNYLEARGGLLHSNISTKPI